MLLLEMGCGAMEKSYIRTVFKRLISHFKDSILITGPIQSVCLTLKVIDYDLGRFPFGDCSLLTLSQRTSIAAAVSFLYCIYIERIVEPRYIRRILGVTKHGNHRFMGSYPRITIDFCFWCISMVLLFLYLPTYIHTMPGSQSVKRCLPLASLQLH